MSIKVPGKGRGVGGGRPATGSIVWADEAKTIPFGVRVTKSNGKRQVVKFDVGTTMRPRWRWRR